MSDKRLLKDPLFTRHDFAGGIALLSLLIWLKSLFPLIQSHLWLGNHLYQYLPLQSKSSINLDPDILVTEHSIKRRSHWTQCKQTHILQSLHTW